MILHAWTMKPVGSTSSWPSATNPTVVLLASPFAMSLVGSSLPTPWSRTTRGRWTPSARLAWTNRRWQWCFLSSNALKVSNGFFFGPKRKLFNFLESSSSWHKRLGDLSQVVASWSIESLGPSWDGAENIELCSRCMCRRRSLHCQMGQDNSRKTSQHCLRCSLLSLWLVANFEPQHDFLSNLLQDGNTDISIQISQVFLSRNTRSKVSKTNFMGKPLLNSSEQSRSGGWIVALVEL